MSVIKFLITHWDSVALVVGMLVGVVVLAKRGELKVLEEIIFHLVIEAERRYGPGTGELKKAAVVGWAYDAIPATLKVLVSRENLEGLIESVLDYAKTKWTQNENLKAYIATGDEGGSK
jgi:hypothetical protein